MARRNRTGKRSAAQAAADRWADDLARELGKALRLARLHRGLTQRQAADQAGISPSMWSHLETARDGRTTLATVNRAGLALGSRLRAYMTEASAADQPRDAAHLRAQELIIRTALGGGWRALPEALIDREARSSRAADVLLRRGSDYALVDVWDWFDDVGAAGRSLSRRLDAVERHAIARMVGDDPLPTASGCWVVRATRRNRGLVSDHRHFFQALLPGSSAAWLAALSSPTAAMPPEPALVWVAVNGKQLFPVGLGPPSAG
jgi:transcriptional regulator with XRE-family HTH domain